MEHLLASGTTHDLADAIAAGERMLAIEATMDTDGILESLASIPSDERARRILRDANITLTKQTIHSSVTADAHLIHAITAVEELDKLINTAAKRVRAWYALHDPELEHRITDHAAFIEAALQQPERAKDTMGGDTSKQEADVMLSHTAAVSGLIAHRTQLVANIDDIMGRVAPNLRHVAGATIGAKLMAMAGSLERLATMPAGTIQLLGAETALFRHLRNPNARPPKHGIIFNHQVLQHARPEDRGRMARTLADVIAIASRVDRFKGEFVGEDLMRRVQERADDLRAVRRPRRQVQEHVREPGPPMHRTPTGGTNRGQRRNWRRGTR